MTTCKISQICTSRQVRPHGHLWPRTAADGPPRAPPDRSARRRAIHRHTVRQWIPPGRHRMGGQERDRRLALLRPRSASPPRGKCHIGAQRVGGLSHRYRHAGPGPRVGRVLRRKPRLVWPLQPRLCGGKPSIRQPANTCPIPSALPLPILICGPCSRSNGPSANGR